MRDLEPCACPPMYLCPRHGLTKPPKPEKSGRMKRTRIQPVSEDQAKLKKRWAFIKACMILAQRRTNGHLSCMQCGAVDPPLLDLDHIIPTGKGGTWTPDNAQLLCRDCHEEKHQNLPQWSAANPGEPGQHGME